MAGGAPPVGSGVTAGGSGGVRDRMVEHARARPSRSAPVVTQLDDFLAEPDPAVALRLWFGDHRAIAGTPDGATIVALLDADIARIDRLLSAQVDAILHHPRFQALEGAWRALRYLTDQSTGDTRVKTRFLTATWSEVCRDLERSIEFDQSNLWDMIYSAQFDTPGGEPYGLLVGLYEVQHRRGPGHPTDDVSALQTLCQIAGASFAPFIVGASPGLFGLDTFTRLGAPLDLDVIFRQPEYVRWRSLRELEDSRFLGITVPRVLMRQPWGDHSQRLDRFRYREDVTDRDPTKLVWVPASVAFAAVVIRAFREHRWFANIRGAPQDTISGGLVANLPDCPFPTEPRGVAIRPATDVAVSDRLELSLNDHGIMALCDIKDTTYQVFHGCPSLQRPKRYDRAEATNNARLSAMLQYMLCTARFSHYVKVMMRDRVGAFTTAEECERFLHAWLLRYVTRNDNLPMERLARFPLREAQVQVREAAGKPGSFNATLHLLPHFQLDTIETGLRLVTELPKSRAA